MNRRLVLLLVAAFCLCFTTVSAFNVVDEIVEFVLDRRQQKNDTTTTIDTTTTNAPQTTPTTTSTTVITSDEKTTPTESSTPSSKPTITIPSSAPTTAEPTIPTPTSTTVSTTTPHTTTTRVVTTRVTTKTREVATVTLTISGTLSLSTVYTSEIQTTIETPTGSAGGAQDHNNNGGSGISVSTRNTIIGVVVGLGGAVIIGALLLVGFRLRKKKAGVDDDVQGLPSSTNPTRQQDAFKATLDQYHKPPGTVNPSANF